MKKSLIRCSLILALLSFWNVLNAQNLVEKKKIVATERGSQDYFGGNVDISGDFAVVGASNEDEDANESNTLSASGSAYILQRVEGEWVLAQKIVASDRQASTYFGYSVSISGDTVVVGALFKTESGNAAAGAAYVFTRNASGTWVQIQKLVAPYRDATSEYFGCDVSLKGAKCIIGAYGENKDEFDGGFSWVTKAGAAFIFEKDPADNLFKLEKKLDASDREREDELGKTVDIFGNYAVAGAPKEDGSPFLAESGAAYVYHKGNDGTWSETQKLTSPNSVEGGDFGSEVAISENFIFVSAPGESTGGQVYVYKKDVSGDWLYHQTLVSSQISSGDYFGKQNSIDVDGDMLIIGCEREYLDGNGENSKSLAGAAYIFQLNSEDNWVEIQSIEASDRTGFDYFGGSVAIDNNRVIVGADSEDHDENGLNNVSAAGAAYIFEEAIATSLKGEAKESRISIYPNPFTNKVAITSTSKLISFRLADVQGNLVAEGLLDSELNKLNLEKLTPGIYFMTIVTEAETWREKLIKH